MKIVRLETFLANAGLRNYLFVRLTTDVGLSGVGEASLEWQERAVEVLLNEWVASRVMSRDPFDIEAVVGGMIRDQYQGGSTVMTAISGAEIALWDIIGKACGQPVYRLMGGRARETLHAYANGWYGACRTPEEFAERARDVAGRGYRAMKFDPFGTAWKALSEEAEAEALAIVEAVTRAAPGVRPIIEFHGRLAAPDAIRVLRKLEAYDILWCEEPIAPESIELLAEVKSGTRLALSAGERLYTVAEFQRLAALRACDIVQMDITHCGGLWVSKKIAALAAVQDMSVSPHCSIGPVAFAAAIHFAYSTPNMSLQECFAEYDVDWRNELVGGWNPLDHGALRLPQGPGLGLELDEGAIAAHPYKPLSFPSLWDGEWSKDFTGASQIGRKRQPD